MRDALPEIEAKGAELIVVGNGNAHFAKAFMEETGYSGPLYVDPSLEVYRAAGMRRQKRAILNPKGLISAAQAALEGHRQSDVRGDAWQLGGVVITKNGEVTYVQSSDHAGDHADVSEILRNL